MKAILSSVLVFMKVLLTILFVIPFWIIMGIVNFILTSIVIIKWVLSGSVVRNNSNNGMFHKLYFSTTYQGQRLFKHVWNV